ncbi:MAG TPA: bifunctional [glutamate--ammonia ligase]-adenylyl-L-tyrosine phosphorylase/[glutamate--ammonia-ligase] adenylyltransferase [Gammaproteobacteria bacterium]|nr:bifunctional [glutamate--ammonia ligase]-adenylyl-L-tyrosine phosphorylase/[glutamate--ammonia-ligase] adenylyltransferase [Gammaproteobacteria bacterium]
MNQDSINHFNKHLLQLPGELQQEVAIIFDEIVDQLPDASANTIDWLGALPAVLSSSPFIVSLIRRDPAYLTELIDNGSLFSPLDIDNLLSTIEASLAATEDEQEMMRCLRYARNQAMLHIAFRDLAGWTALNDVMSSLTNSATALLSAALARTYDLTAARYGTPIGSESGEAQQLIILGMGKLGGGELNFSSDVDLIFCFPEKGQSSANRPLSNQEFFTRQAKLFIKLLTTQTADGFVYRVDTRLRPNGDSGPLCLSFNAMDNYYQLHGRDWERYAYIKARVIAGDREKGLQLLDSLRPFIYRKYLDFSAIESIRDMKEMIERELQRKKMMHRNIKLGLGGIREVEFIAQAHQLIRGGRDPHLQQQSLLPVLGHLHASALISTEEFNTLTNGYAFLRRCENRLQMYTDQQTHNLPKKSPQRLILAFTMGYTDWSTFHRHLQNHMQAIHKIFHALFISTADPEASPPTRSLAHLWGNELNEETACQILIDNHYKKPDALFSRLRAFRCSSLYSSLSTSARRRLDRLLPVLLYEVGHVATDSDETIFRCFDLLTSIVRRPVYLSLLLDNEAVRHQLIRLTAASPYASVLIQRYPVLLDDLLTGYSLGDFTCVALSADLRKRLEATAQGDLELQMGLLREFNHSKLLAVALLDISARLTASETGRALSAIAEACTRESLRLSIRGIIANHGTLENGNPAKVPFCIIAYGKLGSRELGFGSDLDLVFVSANIADSVKTSGPRKVFAAQFFARIGQRLVHIMSILTPAGRMYKIDMRLRPSGNSGPLVTSIGRLQHYQREDAWTWEHQALVRARVIAGDPALAETFNTLRKEILCRWRDEEKLRTDIVSMREKMRQAKNTLDSNKFDLKQGHGGIVDIEFMVQYMVLRWAREYPQLVMHTETMVLLDVLKNLELLAPETHRVLTGAFSSWLEKSYQLKLNEQQAMIPAVAANTLSRQVTEIWNTLLSGKQ